MPRSPHVEQSRMNAALRQGTTKLSASSKQHQRRSTNIINTTSLSDSDKTRPPLRRAQTAPFTLSRSDSINSHSSSLGGRATPSSTDTQSLGSDSPKKEWGSLEDYPLREPSAICRAKGGGRWEPVPQPMWDGYRPPYGKAAYEIAMEQEEEMQRVKNANPITRNGG